MSVIILNCTGVRIGVNKLYQHCGLLCENHLRHAK